MKNLILLHGALGASKQFDEISSILDVNFNIHRFDFANHGNAERYDGDISIDLFTRQLESYINENNIAGAYIFGYSMGGYVALNHALKYSGKTAEIFTLATKFDWNPNSSVKEAKMLAPDTILEKVPKYADELKALHGDKWKDLLLKTSRMMIQLGDNQPFSLQDLSRITCKVTIAVGEEDSMVTMEESLQAYRNLQHGRFLVLKDTKHPFAKVDKKILARELIEFFN